MLDGATGRLEAWGGDAPATTPPLYSWSLASFFEAEAEAVEAEAAGAEPSIS